jgi:hypothetical protein
LPPSHILVTNKTSTFLKEEVHPHPNDADDEQQPNKEPQHQWHHPTSNRRTHSDYKPTKHSTKYTTNTGSSPYPQLILKTEAIFLEADTIL